MPAEDLVRARCVGCGGGLSFEEFSRGRVKCVLCANASKAPTPAATFVRGPQPAPGHGTVRRRNAASVEPAARRASRPTTTMDRYERVLEDVPDQLIDEIVAALEGEAERLAAERARQPAPVAAVNDVLDEIGFGATNREFQLAAWGFAAGFGANVIIAKYAQMQSGAPITDFLGPLLLGGLVAGAACGAIGWGLAKLREH